MLNPFGAVLFMNMIVKKCEVCKKEFYKTGDYGKKGWDRRKYCSRKCNFSVNGYTPPKTGKTLICKICSKPFYARNWELTRTQYKRKCCSFACYNKSRKRTKILVNCNQCGKEFYLRPDRISEKMGNFCSKKCISENLKTGISKECLICGKTFYAHKSRLEKNGGKFCSNKCYWIYNSGENSHSWQGGKSFEPYTTDWKETLKRSIRERDKYICQICDKEPSVYVHHIDYDKKNCDPKNLITLCSSCHPKTNFNRNYWIKFFERTNIKY